MKTTEGIRKYAAEQGIAKSKEFVEKCMKVCAKAWIC